MTTLDSAPTHLPVPEVYVALERAQGDVAFITAFIHGAHRDPEGFARMARLMAVPGEPRGA